MKSLSINGNRLLLSIIILFFNIIISAQNSSYELDDVVVTAGRTPVTFSNLSRTVTIISKETIKNTPASSVPDLLQYVSGIDVKQQNANGVQADVSIRGGNFEQTLILVDGIRLSDPQTGHHNMSLPVSINDIEKIEVLKGQGSQSFGANAFSGVINIITKKNQGTSLNALLEGGQNGYYNLNLSGSHTLGILTNRIAFSTKKSDGYAHNTDFNVVNLSYRPSISFKQGVVNFIAGYTDNDFGANGFYGNYPNQIEHVKTTLLSASGEFQSSLFQIVPKVYWRNNKDRYQYDYINFPDRFINEHESKSYGGELQLSHQYSLGTLSFGGEYGKDDVVSTNLGDHTREKYGFFAEQTINTNIGFSASVGVFAYKYASIGWKYWPGIDLGYKISSSARIYASFGKGFRLPSYTELYYSSPSSVGNPNLNHEEVTNYETGIYFDKNFYDINLSLFLKDGKNLIDYIQNNDDLKWYAENITEIKTKGVELSFSFYPSRINGNCFFEKVSFAYTYLDLDKDDGNSRYVLENLRHQVNFGIFHKIPFDIMFNWILKYEQRVNSDSYFITDINVSKTFDYFQMYIKATNLFNEYHSNIFNFQKPGRWITAGIKFGL